eukprot:3586824-Prorocentrum_lima.AAC.1
MSSPEVLMRRETDGLLACIAFAMSAADMLEGGIVPGRSLAPSGGLNNSSRSTGFCSTSPIGAFNSFSTVPAP